MAVGSRKSLLFLIAACASVMAGGISAAEDRPRPKAAAAFAAHEKHAHTRWDDQFIYVESDGLPEHEMMVGITAWQQQVPLPQPYTGDNAWRFPLTPKPASSPLSAKTGFFRGAIAIAVNGVPIFNPIKNDGRTDTFLAGELDVFGGHSGRADDYHYHIAPVFLNGGDPAAPVAFALDGYPIYGYTEPDGSPVRPLDAMNGHDDPKLGYHYHATKTYPYLNGGFHGEVVEREGQVDPQPHAHPVREATTPLAGATITAFKAEPGGKSWTLTYEQRGKTGTVRYSIEADGSYRFRFTNPDGTTREQTYRPNERGQGGGGDKPPREGSPGGAPNGGREKGGREKGGREGDGRGERPGGTGGTGGAPRGGPDPNDPNRKPWITDHAAEIDADHDGTVTREEMTAEVTTTFSGYDRDKNGSISADERDAEGGVRSAMGGFVRGHWSEVDQDASGTVTSAEISAVAFQMFSRADRDGDGKLTTAELTAPRTQRGGGKGRDRDAQRPPADGGNETAAGPVKPRAEDTIRATVYADNWFMLYVNGKPVAVDPIDFLPHNVVTFDFLPEYPMTIAVLVKDNADPKTGLEYGNRIGDGGFVLKFADGTVTNATWKAKCFARGPIGNDTANPRTETTALPDDWFAVAFDDSAWPPATEFPAERVGPPAGATPEELEGARYIWTKDLDLDNTVIFRTRIERAGWKPRWTTRPDLDVGDSPRR